MKAVFLQFTDHEGKVTKTYTACSLKTGMIDNLFEIAEKAQGLKTTENVREIMSFFKDLKAIIVEVFGKQFTYDELNKNVEQDELMKVFNELCSRISGELQQKN